MTFNPSFGTMVIVTPARRRSGTRRGGSFNPSFGTMVIVTSTAEVHWRAWMVFQSLIRDDGHCDGRSRQMTGGCRPFNPSFGTMVIVTQVRLTAPHQGLGLSIPHSGRWSL